MKSCLQYGVHFVPASVLMHFESYRWFSARLQYLQCISTGDTAVLYWAIDIDFTQTLHCIV